MSDKPFITATPLDAYSRDELRAMSDAQRRERTKERDSWIATVGPLLASGQDREGKPIDASEIDAIMRGLEQPPRDPNVPLTAEEQLDCRPWMREQLERLIDQSRPVSKPSSFRARLMGETSPAAVNSSMQRR